VFDEIPHSTKVLKRHQNHDDPDDPGIMAWDHYTDMMHLIICHDIFDVTFH
jgi:hypothetical protein